MLLPWALASDIEIQTTEMTGNAMSFTSNEYDMLISARALPEDELNEYYSSDEINAIRAAEDAFYARAQLPEDVLAQYGYTPNQINILKSYDGGPLEDHPELRAVASEFSCSITPMHCSSTSVGAQFNWSWSTWPIIYYLTDSVGVVWRGTNTQSGNMNCPMDTSRSFSYVTYYTLANEIHEVEHLSFMNPSPYEAAKVEFSAGHTSAFVGDPQYFAKTGRMQVVVTPAPGSTGTLLEAGFVFVYGHRTVQTSSPAISFPASFSITLGTCTSEMCREGAYITTGGSMRPMV